MEELWSINSNFNQLDLKINKIQIKNIKNIF
jgi:hypothetical protein